MAEQYQNFAYGTTTNSLNNSSNPVTIDLNSGAGASFPSTTNGPFRITVQGTGANTATEVMIVTTRVTDVLTAYRGTAIATYGAAEVPTPTLSTWAAGAIVSGNLTSGVMNQIKLDVASQILTSVYGDYSAITTPTPAVFTTQIASPAVVNVSFTTNTYGGLSGVVLRGSATTGNDTNLITELYPVPSIPYSIRTRFWPMSGYNQYAFAGGLCLYNSTNTNFIVYGGFSRNQSPSNGPELRIAQYNNTISFSGSPLESMAWGFPGRAGLCDLQIVDNGTSRTYYIIGDGCVENRVQFYTETNTTFLTPTHVGIFIAPGYNQTPNGPVAINVIDFTQGTS